MKNSTQGLQAVLTFDNIWMAALLNFGQVFRRQYYLWIHCIQCKNKAFILKPAAMFPINIYIYIPIGNMAAYIYEIYIYMKMNMKMQCNANWIEHLVVKKKQISYG